MHKSYLTLSITLALILITKFTWVLLNSPEITLPIHFHVSEPEARLAAGCLLPRNLSDELILSKIHGISAKRAQLIFESLQDKKVKTIKNKEHLIKYFQNIPGIGPKLSQTLASKVSYRHSTELCEVLVR